MYSIFLHANLVGFASMAGGSILWEVVGRTADVSFFPPLSAVISRAVELSADGTIPQHLASSLVNLAIGFTIAFGVGITVGVLMGAFWRFNAALNVFVMAFLTTPTLVLAPVFFSILGLSRATPIAIIVFYSMFIMILNARAGIHTAQRDLVQMAESFGATRRQVLLFVLVPAALPLILAGVRLGATRAVKGMINGEMFIAIVGLGGVIVSAGRVFDATTVLAVLLCVVALALFVNSAIGALDRKLTSWVPSIARP